MAAKKVIDAAWLHGPSYDLASQAAFALESAQLLMSPEVAAELVQLRARVAFLEAERTHLLGGGTPPAEGDLVELPSGDRRTVTRAWVSGRGDRRVDLDDGCSYFAGTVTVVGRAEAAGPSGSGDKLTAIFAPTQALREDEVASDEDPIVAYRDPHNPRVLLCREHGPRYVGMVPVSCVDLPDGGLCNFGRLSSLECGVDVLIDEPTTGGVE